MYLRFGLGLVAVAVALCLGVTRAEYEGPADADDVPYRVARDIRERYSPGFRPPQPSPTFPRLPRDNHIRYREDVEEHIRYVRSLQPFNPRLPSPVPAAGMPIKFPSRPRFRRSPGGGSVSVDVDKSRGSRAQTRVTVEQNLYKSNNGRTRVDASGYATNRGDRGGMINFSHRFR